MSLRRRLQRLSRVYQPRVTVVFVERCAGGWCTWPDGRPYQLEGDRPVLVLEWDDEALLRLQEQKESEQLTAGDARAEIGA